MGGRFRVARPRGAVLTRLVVVLAAVAAAAAGCGGGDERREAYEEYVEAANAAQEDFEPAFNRAQSAIRTFAAGRSGERVAKRLREAASAMRAAHGSLALVEPPEEADALHRDLLRLLDLQAQLALELSLAAEYVPRVSRLLAAPDAASRRLQRALRQSKDPAEQVSALRSFARELDLPLNRLESLAPPPVLAPWQRTQERRVRASQRLALELADAIDAGDRSAVDRALTTFESRTGNARAANAAQREAVALFNRRLERQNRLLQRIAREQFRIASEIG